MLRWKFLSDNPYYSSLLRSWQWCENDCVCKSNGINTSCYYPSSYGFDSFYNFLREYEDREIHILKLTFYTRWNNRLIFSPVTLGNRFHIEDYVNIEEVPVDIEAIII
jgi:hypothetical protein